ncbi:MAG: hypothetical protein IJU50_07490 [Lachnospiraceae bacterium]|nr:hypothetical protein [Lachnospiraceae bacterium]
MASEKELNVELMARLKIVKGALEIAREENAEKTVKYLENEEYWLEQMLYQKPPLTGKDD